MSICQNKYNCIRVPYILQPCSHGLCKTCVEEYITNRGNSLCPKCTHIDRHTINYDLKEVCDVSLSGWKETLMEVYRKTPV